jgi:phage terminase large subunit
MTEVKIDEAVFNEVYIQHLDDSTRTQIFYGGSGSGKSVFLAQRAVIDLMRGGRNYLILRAIAKTIRHSVFKEIEKENNRVEDAVDEADRDAVERLNSEQLRKLTEGDPLNRGRAPRD